jgi:S-methylmethionine-dependent homocysteine/selenocysteine methylase
MYRHGHQLREFAMFELMDSPTAVTDLKDMYRRYLDIAAKHGFAALVAGFDYRASPDWGQKLGYSDEGLREMQHKCIDFLRHVSLPYSDQVPRIAIAGCVGPRGDAYSLSRNITAEEAEDYHMTQLKTL